MEYGYDIIWKDIANYEGYYQVSNIGTVRSLDKIVKRRKYGNFLKEGRIMSLQHNSVNGYQYISLSFENKKILHLVHRLVATAFIYRAYDLTEINHKDGNKLNNCVENLEWCTSSQNKLHAYKTLNKKNGLEGKTLLSSKSNKGRVIGINNNGQVVFDLSCAAEAERHSLSRHCISSVINGHYKSYKGLFWKRG